MHRNELEGEQLRQGLRILARLIARAYTRNGVDPELLDSDISTSSVAKGDRTGFELNGLRGPADNPKREDGDVNAQ